ncbi:T9SS type A sorting domain-containing protein, partial [Flavilitoribacter nigricans]
PICINGLAIELMPVIPAADVDGDGDDDTGAMAIWASDFIASPMTDCTGEVKYSINRVGEEVDADQTGLTLTCDDDASLLVEIWAWDGLGNGDFCETYVLVQDNNVSCADSEAASIAGFIETEEAAPVENVMVELSGNQFQTMQTKFDGHYLFEGMETGFDYTITPEHDIFPLNGVTTFDLILISKHVLGIQPVDSPYKRIAADINRDGRITVMDAVALRKLILNIDLKFKSNTSWRFIPADYVFPNPENPWQEEFPELINVNNLQTSLADEDFIAVKIGDLNLSAKANALQAEQRNLKGSFLLQVADRELAAGTSYRIDFRAADIRKIQGYQLTLKLDPEMASVTDIQYGLATAEHFGLRYLKDGLIANSWSRPGVEIDADHEDSVLFSLEIRARADVRLSEILGVSSRVTAAEAYDLQDGLMDVGIEFNSGTLASVAVELYQNVPNPFREVTNIGFYLPEGGEATLSIHDADGRVIKLIRGTFAPGNNQLQLKRADLGKSGVLYYTLTTGTYTATKKMILIE